MSENRERGGEAERRRGIAAVFGDALPEGTGDERPDGWGKPSSRGGAGDDDWLRQQVPPHHG